MATQATGATRRAPGPQVRAQKATTAPNRHGKSARARQSRPMTAIPIGIDSPPYWTTTSDVQYTMPRDDTAPVR